MHNTQTGIVLGQIMAAQIDTAITQESIIAGEFSTPPYNPSGGDKHYEHTQRSASSVWNVAHNLRKYPAVSVVDSGGSIVIGEVNYIDENNLVIKFTAPFTGKAYCN